MNIPNNEGMACDAVIRHLEKWTGEMRDEIRHPEKEGVGPPVELRLQLGNQKYAIEHTRVESFDNQIKAGISIRELKKFIKKRSLRTPCRDRFTTNCKCRWMSASLKKGKTGSGC